MKKLSVAVVGLFAVIAASGCVPDMEITLTLNRAATLVYHSSTHTSSVTLTGTVRCTRSEPVDLWATVAESVNGTVVSDTAGGSSVRCDGPDGNTWSKTFDFDGTHFVPGAGQMSVTGCTNGGSSVDDDCYSISRSIVMSSS